MFKIYNSLMYPRFVLNSNESIFAEIRQYQYYSIDYTKVLLHKAFGFCVITLLIKLQFKNLLFGMFLEFLSIFHSENRQCMLVYPLNPIIAIIVVQDWQWRQEFKSFWYIILRTHYYDCRHLQKIKLLICIGLTGTDNDTDFNNLTRFGCTVQHTMRLFRKSSIFLGISWSDWCGYLDMKYIQESACSVYRFFPF